MHREAALAPLAYAAERAIQRRAAPQPLHPTATADDLRRRFCVDLPEAPQNALDVVADLAQAAEPGLVGNTDGNFYAWVMGGSSPVGVAADWLTAAWGQNAAIYQTAPAAAIAEEAVSAWLLDLLDLPRDASVGLVTGATMAAFVGLAAARTEVLSRAGHNFEKYGLQGAPQIKAFMSCDAHATNVVALRHIGLGEENIELLPADTEGRMSPEALSRALAAHQGPKIIIAQAGHINSGAFEDFQAIAAIAKRYDAWVHIDGAFGLWARVLAEKASLTRGLELADSWSVDGHKWLQIPYDSGFAIVRHQQAHRRAMDVTASYLNSDAADGRNPTHYAPELSRRARGFAAWAVLKSLGRSGVRSLIARHCSAAEQVANHLRHLPGLRVMNNVCLNQIALATVPGAPQDTIAHLARMLNATGTLFVRPAIWQGTEILRLSIISHATDESAATKLIEKITECWNQLDLDQRSGAF